MNFITPPKVADTPPITPAAVANHLIHLEIQYSLTHIITYRGYITMLLVTLHHLRPDFPLSF